jgi:dTMP kinase
MRGKFIVFEGLDRSGKSTQTKLLTEYLSQRSNTELIGFPNRQSEIGSMINKYLTSQVEVSHQAIHLLFSANRWESMADIEKKLSSGINICCDRYYYSGVAYSTAKGLDM